MFFGNKAAMAVFTLMLAGLPAIAQTRLVFASDATFPPMEYLDSAQEVVGYDVDLINAVAKAGGFTAVIKNTPWNGIFTGLAAGDYDAVISSVTILDQRKATMDFSQPYLNAGQTIIVKLGTSGMATLKQLSGRRVGVRGGTTGAAKVAKNRKIHMVPYAEANPAVVDLALGKLDAVVLDSPSAVSYAFQNENFKGKFTIVGKPLTDEYYGIAVKKGNVKVLQMINRGLAKVSQDGTLEKLELKWLR